MYERVGSCGNEQCINAQQDAIYDAEPKKIPNTRYTLHALSKQLSIGIFATVACTASVALAHDNHELGFHNNVEVTNNPFWANRLGGGREDVFVRTVEGVIHTDLSPYSEVSPTNKGGGEWEYDISADNEAYIVHPELDLQTDVDVLSDGPESRSAVSAIRPIPMPEGIASRSSIEKPNRVGILSQGSWKVRTRSASSPDPLMINHENSDYALSMSQKEEVTKKGRRIYLSAYLVGVARDEHESLTRSGDVINSRQANVKVIVKRKGRRVLSKKLRDSGNSKRHNDLVKGDGRYGAVIELTQPGDYEILIKYKTTLDGQRVKRSSTTSALVSETRLKAITSAVSATSDYVLKRRIEQGRYGIPVSVRTTRGSMPEYVKIRAEVWAKDPKGADSVVGWTGGMVQPTQLSSNSRVWQIPFTFHTGWLLQDEYQGPLTLRNLTIRSVSTGDDLLWNGEKHIVTVSGIDIDAEQRRHSARRSDKTLAESMEVGVHPSFIDDNGRMGNS